MKNKEKGLLLFCTGMLALLCIYLIFANTFIRNFAQHVFFQKPEILLSSYKKDATLVGVEEIGSRSDMMETVFLKGWAYTPTSLNNDEKTLSCLLWNGKQIYEFETDMLSKRPDLSALDSVYGVRHGFDFQVSTVGVSAGTYDIYLYCHENDTNYGVIFTGYQLEKENGIQISPWQSAIVEEHTASTVEDVRSVVDSYDVQTDGTLLVNGWAFLENVETTGQTVYVKLTKTDSTSAVYTTMACARSDVGAAYDSERYNNAGFTAVIPEGFVSAKEEIAEVTIYVEDSVGTWHTS